MNKLTKKLIREGYKLMTDGCRKKPGLHHNINERGIIRHMMTKYIKDDKVGFVMFYIDRQDKRIICHITITSSPLVINKLMKSVECVQCFFDYPDKTTPGMSYRPLDNLSGPTIQMRMN